MQEVLFDFKIGNYTIGFFKHRVGKFFHHEFYCDGMKFYNIGTFFILKEGKYHGQ